MGLLGFGYDPRFGFREIDLGPTRSWGMKFAPWLVPFVKKTPPERERSGESRTPLGARVACAARVCVAGIEVARQVILEAQGAVLPIVAQLVGLRWVFIALALVGIAVTDWTRGQDWRGKSCE